MRCKMHNQKMEKPVGKPRENGVHACADIDGETVYMEDMIMEMRLGRKLTDREMVIHKNGNTLDNRDSNLEIASVADFVRVQ